MRRNLIAGISIIALAGSLISIKLEAATIFVDGMSPEMTAAGVALKTEGHYQGPYLQSSDLGVKIEEKEKNWNYVGWSGNSLSDKDVRQGIDKLKDEIITFHKTSPDEPINIVSHSYGTVIAYKALEEISNSNDPNIKNIKIDTFITMGSPLGASSVGQIPLVREAADIPVNKSLEKPENIKHWLNYYADHDGFGGPINKKGVVEDIKMQGDHDVYFTNPNNAIEIAFVLDTFNKLSKDGNTIKNISTNSSQQAVINDSTQQAVELPKTLPTTGLLQGRISPELAKKLALDSSQLSERTSQQQVTPVSTSFTQTFDGLFTQSADSLGSLGGNHSGTLTDGTRIGVGSRPGDFTSGSFSGRTIAETGYSPATQNNAAFSGSSVGTATAKGFQEGTLSGSMTVTVPAGTQTATVSGSITISTDGSLSMPSYSGPVTDNGTSTKVGTMSGSWSQGPTQ